MQTDALDVLIAMWKNGRCRALGVNGTVKITGGRRTTYKEKYSKAESLEELKKMAVEDAKFIFITPERVRAIEEAVNAVAEEKGWTNE